MKVRNVPVDNFVEQSRVKRMFCLQILIDVFEIKMNSIISSDYGQTLRPISMDSKDEM